MQNDIYIIILSIILICNILSFGIGYILGHIRFVGGVSIKEPIAFSKPQKNNNNISIDTTKVVLELKTDNLEKKYNNLGEQKTTQENISNSINKLKNMKG